jgi:hypothetical protein
MYFFQKGSKTNSSGGDPNVHFDVCMRFAKDDRHDPSAWEYTQYVQRTYTVTDPLGNVPRPTKGKEIDSTVWVVFRQADEQWSRISRYRSECACSAQAFLGRMKHFQLMKSFHWVLMGLAICSSACTTNDRHPPDQITASHSEPNTGIDLQRCASVTGFSEYDRAFIVAVQSKWYALLDEHRGSMRVGKVVLEFRLHSDGRISNMKMTDNGVGKILGLYCQSAILEPAPYLPWPDEMRRAIGANHRDVKFTFFYN